MRKTPQEYVSSLKSVLNIELYEWYVEIILGCKKHKYEYKSAEDLKDYIINFYFDNIYNWTKVQYAILWKLYWITHQQMIRKTKHIEEKIAIYLQNIWYNV